MGYRFSNSLLDQKLLLPFCRRVSSVQRNWIYPIKKRVLTFSPISSPRSARCLLVVQFRPQDFLDALWAAWSWLRHDLPDCRPCFVCDGTPPRGSRETIAHLFPGGRLEEASAVARTLPEQGEDFRAYLSEHVFARKTAVIQSLQRDHDILFSDPDVLVLKPPTQIVTGIQEKRALFSRNHDADHFDPWMAHQFAKLGIAIERDFNSGILFLPRRSLPDSLLDAVFSGWRQAPPHRHTGQSYFSGALTMAQAEPLCPEQYVARSDSMWFWQKEMSYDAVVARHYVGPVRHHLYGVGMPYLLRTAKDEE